jgi:hypothetical protein
MPSLLSWDYGIKAIRATFKKEGYIRLSTYLKPPLTYKNQI